ncbi:hypothetical protein RF11_11641 [Thelohanellus kitauei]|uniref:Uncharacterized protein n=1 Tax=Thelohanellus kitauei TaxID=669202 RepID=A0A0C2MNG6_THEKT|nr:hypothetical protein RF11_11641 [Thelohanellus kitauei]
MTRAKSQEIKLLKGVNLVNLLFSVCRHFLSYTHRLNRKNIAAYILLAANKSIDDSVQSLYLATEEACDWRNFFRNICEYSNIRHFCTYQMRNRHKRNTQGNFSRTFIQIDECHLRRGRQANLERLLLGDRNST